MIHALCLALAQDPAPHGDEPDERAPIAGLVGFHAVSRIDFGQAQNRLTADYVFPDRARWHFESYEAKERSEHLFLYRRGALVWQFAQGRSQALEGAERDAVLLQMELRRAVMLWPDGFSWGETAGGLREAQVTPDSRCGGTAIGRLVATMQEGRPARITAHDVSGLALETLELTSSEERNGRPWPAGLALLGGDGKRQFQETIESVETRVRFLELYFIPPDRRPGTAGAPGTGVVATNVVPMTYRVRSLASGTSWSQATRQARQWIAEERAPGIEVDPVPTFEVTAEGQPARCLVRLAVAADPPPEGFVTVPEGIGFLLSLPGLEALDRSLLDSLIARVPEGHSPGTPYLRVHDRARMPIELVLPLQAD